jgi:hypothetical protein
LHQSENIEEKKCRNGNSEGLSLIELNF